MPLTPSPRSTTVLRTWPSSPSAADYTATSAKWGEPVRYCLLKEEKEEEGEEGKQGEWPLFPLFHFPHLRAPPLPSLRSLGNKEVALRYGVELEQQQI